MKEIRIRPIWLAAGAITVAAAAVAGGYWIGGRQNGVSIAQPLPGSSPAANVQLARRVPLYYQDPDGKPDYSPEPRKTADGRDFVPVYEDVSSTANATASAPAISQGKGRILYYRNPMGLPDTSPVPKNDSMGMAYIPVYENETPSDSGIVQVSPGRMQMLGVRTAPVEAKAQVARTIRANGIVEINERSQSVVTTKVSGWIERLHVAATGEAVRRGQALFELYAPDLVAAQQEFLIAAQLNTAGNHEGAAHLPAEALVDAALQRLRTLDVPEEEIARLRRTGKVARRIVVPAPATGIVLEKQAVEGMHVEPGMPLYKIADMSNVWLIADVQEQDLGSLRTGAAAHASFVSFPGRVFNGHVDFIYPTLASETRTARARIVLSNPGFVLRTSMYATVDIDAPSNSLGQMLVVPDSAIIDSGTRQIVLVERGEGRFEPRPVRVGERGGGYVQVLEGLKQGEIVVTSANFLIDAESNLRAALSSLAGSQPNTGTATPSGGAQP